MNYIQSQSGAAIYLCPRAYVGETPTEPQVTARMVVGWEISDGMATPIVYGSSYEELDATYFISIPTFDNGVLTKEGEVFDSLKEWALACHELAEVVEAELVD